LQKDDVDKIKSITQQPDDLKDKHEKKS